MVALKIDNEVMLQGDAFSHVYSFGKPADRISSDSVCMDAPLERTKNLLVFV